MEHPGQVFSSEQIYEKCLAGIGKLYSGKHGNGSYQTHSGEN